MKQKNAKYNNKNRNVVAAAVEKVVKPLPRWVFIPIAIILIIIPLITIIHHFDCGLENYEWFS